MAQDSPQAKYSSQNVLNNVYDQELKSLAVLLKGWNGQDGQTFTPDAMATKVTSASPIYYVAMAAPGTSQATASWQAQKIDTTDSNNIVITWADGGSFSQVASDLTALTYT